MFIAALFTIAKTWKQPKCPSTDEWIKKMWYTYTKEYYSAIKKNEILPLAATQIDLLSEVNQAEKDKYYMISLTSGILKKKIQMNLFTKQTHRHRKQIYGYQRGKGRGGINQEFGINRYTLIYIK